jgi:hypothetical protein
MVVLAGKGPISPRLRPLFPSRLFSNFSPPQFGLYLGHLSLQEQQHTKDYTEDNASVQLMLGEARHRPSSTLTDEADADVIKIHRMISNHPELRAVWPRALADIVILSGSLDPNRHSQVQAASDSMTIEDTIVFQRQSLEPSDDFTFV